MVERGEALMLGQGHISKSEPSTEKKQEEKKAMKKQMRKWENAVLSLLPSGHELQIPKRMTQWPLPLSDGSKNNEF
jgi:hypothetical protein